MTYRTVQNVANLGPYGVAYVHFPLICQVLMHHLGPDVFVPCIVRKRGGKDPVVMEVGSGGANLAAILRDVQHFLHAWD